MNECNYLMCTELCCASADLDHRFTQGNL